MNFAPLILFAGRLGWAVIHSLWQGVVVVALLVLVLAMLRNRSAAARHTACLGGLALVLACCSVTLSLGFSPAPASPVASIKSDTAKPPEHISALPPLHTPAAEIADHAPAEQVTFLLDPKKAETRRPDQNADSSISWRTRGISLVPWIGVAWITGAALLLLRRLGGWWRVWELKHRGVFAPSAKAHRSLARLVERLGLCRGVRLLESSRALVPMVLGTLRPLILLPTRTITGLSEPELEAILAHELAHLARGDTWAHAFQLLVETILFYHPAIWWIGERAGSERERAADDLALRLCDTHLTYARALAKLAEMGTASEPALAATDGNILNRIRRILGQSVKPEPAGTGWLLTLAAVVIAAALLPLHAEEAAPTVHVAAGESLQAAIDAAAPGSVIELGPGEWKERVLISKPLSLVGAGWEKTRLVVEEPAAEEIKTAFEEVQLLQKAATTPGEKEKAAAEWVRRIARPAIWVRGTEGVTLRNLRVQGHSTLGRNDGGTASTLVQFEHAKALMRECAVVGPFGRGIQIADGANVEIRGSLVAAIWNDGIVVYGRDEKGPSRLRLLESEVRNVYHYGVAIGRGCDTTLIERCRISGTAWHGIRYDDASPTITGNVIFQNARSGIYASGTTHAAVRGNLLWKNEMDGISCWFENTDMIEGNTFRGNRREALLVVGAKPAVTRNVFSSNPIALSCSKTERRGSGFTPVGAPVLSANLFYDNPVVLQIGEEKKPAPEGSLTVDPNFHDPAGFDFTLSVDSPALAAGIGVAEPLSPSGPWPILAEEKAIVPEGETREFSFWTAPGEAKRSKPTEDLTLKARTDAKSVLSDVFQLDDSAKRAGAIERIRTLLGSADPTEARIGLAAFVAASQVEFDKPSFRPVLRPLFTAPAADLRAQALTALAIIGPSAEDLTLALGLLHDASGEVRTALPGAIKGLSADGFTGQAGAAILQLLEAGDGKVTQAVWHTMWGTKISPELEARVVAASRKDDNGTGYSEVFYYALSVHLSKREPTVTRLIELAASQDTINVAGRCLWGLQQGVEKDQEPRVAELALKVLDARSDGYMRGQALLCLRAYGTTTQAAPLKVLLAKPGVSGEFKQKLEATLATIENRPPGR